MYRQIMKLVQLMVADSLFLLKSWFVSGEWGINERGLTYLIFIVVTYHIHKPIKNTTIGQGDVRLQRSHVCKLSGRFNIVRTYFTHSVDTSLWETSQKRRRKSQVPAQAKTHREAHVIKHVLHHIQFSRERFIFFRISCTYSWVLDTEQF